MMYQRTPPMTQRSWILWLIPIALLVFIGGIIGSATMPPGVAALVVSAQRIIVIRMPPTEESSPQYDIIVYDRDDASSSIATLAVEHPYRTELVQQVVLSSAQWLALDTVRQHLCATTASVQEPTTDAVVYPVGVRCTGSAGMMMGKQVFIPRSELPSAFRDLIILLGRTP